MSSRILARLRGQAGNAPAPQPAHNNAPQHLTNALVENEANFIALLNAMPAHEYRATMTPPVVRSLIRQSLDADRPGATLRLRAMGPGFRFAYRTCRDTRLVQYARENRPPNLSAMLFQEGLLDEAACIEALRLASPAAFMEVVDDGRAAPLVEKAALARPAPLDRAVLRDLLERNLLSPRAYCRLVAPNGADGEVDELLSDCAAGRVDTVDVFAHVNPTVAQITAWIERGLITPHDVMTHANNISAEVVRDWWDRDVISIDDYVASGSARVEDVETWLKNTTVDAKQAIQLYRLSPNTLDDLYTGGRIDSDTHLTASTRAWGIYDALPLQHVQRVRACAGIEALNTVIGELPKPETHALRRSFVLRLYAEHAEGLVQQPPQSKNALQRLAQAVPESLVSTAKAVQAVPLGILGDNIWPLYTWLAKSLVGPAQETSPTEEACVSASEQALPEAEAPVVTCLACDEPIDAESPGMVFGKCEHPAQFHTECLRMSVKGSAERGVALCCPTVDCRQKLTLADGRALRLEQEQADTLAREVINANRPDNFRACTTDGCCGGSIANDWRVRFDCGVCGVTQKLRTEFDELHESLVALIDGMGVNGVIRGCYHCGQATERTFGCSKMTCGRNQYEWQQHGSAGCGQEWHFTLGGKNDEQAYYHLEQRYVPRSGAMVRAGLFAPLEAGYVHNHGQLPNGATSLQELVTNNAIAKGWLRRENGGLVTV